MLQLWYLIKEIFKLLLTICLLLELDTMLTDTRTQIIIFFTESCNADSKINTNF